MKTVNTCTLLLAVALLLASSTQASCFGTPSTPKSVLLSKVPSSFSSSSPSRRFLLTTRGGSTNPDNNTGGETPPPSPVPPVPSQEDSVELGTATPAAPSTTTTASNSLMGAKATPPGLVRRTFPSFPWHRLPNLLTYIRCLAIPGLMVLFELPNRHVETSVLFAFASITDWLDGYLARRWDITSNFGAFLDPVADKLMVSTALILLSGRYGTIVSIPTAIILAREIAVSALREWMAQRGARDSVKVGYQGKVKTALTMVSLTVLLLVPSALTEGATKGFLSKLYQPGIIMLDLSALITITSGSVYFRAAGPALMGKE
mmetsp:Transcript_18268/g.25746  ORF Transcript_18268/g.25746 Transcript_18268/m.25746 type:complete len:318 (-) Transcript_18268:206-1159(-)